MRVVGLTGGIATGKSTVGSVLAGLGVAVIDADQVARAVVERGQPALDEIGAAFGPDVIRDDGSLDRRALRERVMADRGELMRLEAITHPRIVAAILAGIQAFARSGADAVVLEAAILLEAGWDTHCDQILVTTCPPEEQVRRVVRRDGVSADQARAVLRNQLSSVERVARADAVVDTSGPEATLPQRVEEAWATLSGGAPGQ